MKGRITSQIAWSSIALSATYGLAGAQSLVIDPLHAVLSRSADEVPVGQPAMTGLSTPPVIGSTGYVAFTGGVQFNGGVPAGGDALWRITPSGVLQLLAYSGQTAPGTSGQFGSFSSPIVDDAGGVAAFASVDGGGDTREGIWYFTPTGGVQKVVSERDIVGIGDERIGAGNGRRFSMARSGAIAVHSTISGTTTNTRSRMLLWQNGVLAPGPQIGSLVPNTNIPCLDSTFQSSVPSQDNTVMQPTFIDLSIYGAVRSRKGPSCSLFPNDSEEVILGFTNLAQFFVEGVPAADESGAPFGVFKAFDTALESTGTLGVIAARLETNSALGIDESNDNGIWVFNPVSAPSVVRVLREGQQVSTSEGDVYTVSSFSPQVSAALGTLAVIADLQQGNSEPLEAVLVRRAGVWTAVAVESKCSGTSSRCFRSNTSEVFGPPSVNALGEIAFTARTRGCSLVNDPIITSIHVWSPSAGLMQVVYPQERLIVSNPAMCFQLFWQNIPNGNSVGRPPTLERSNASGGQGGLTPGIGVHNGVGRLVFAASGFEISSGVLRDGVFVVEVPTVSPLCSDVDFNNDGAVFDPVDLELFIAAFSEAPCPATYCRCDGIDFNGDCSAFDPGDIDDFLSVFSEGSCS